MSETQSTDKPAGENKSHEPEIPIDVRLKRMTVEQLTAYATSQARQYREKREKAKRLQEDIGKTGKLLVVIQDELKRRDIKV
ncbi:MAG: hypothetical protein AAF432_02260 [Planctomycetota bacterium]